jgi:hypothetical protein
LGKSYLRSEYPVVAGYFILNKTREMYYTYTLYSRKYDKIYVGSTSDIKKRLANHNEGKSRYTSRKRIYKKENHSWLESGRCRINQGVVGRRFGN